MRFLSSLKCYVWLLIAALGLCGVASAQQNARALQFRTKLTPLQEVPPALGSRASGTAVIKVDRRRHKATVQVDVRRINNVILAHLHLAPRGENGPIVVPLYEAPPAGPEKGRLLTRTITAADFVNNLEGLPFETLIAELNEGNIYVNVHTVQFPNGEIRGQFERRRRR